MNRIGRFLIGSSLLMAVVAIITPSAQSAPPPSVSHTAALLVTGLQGATGSTVGPDGALYVTEGAAGQDLARRSANRGAHNLRQRSAEGDPGGRHRWSDRRRVH